MSHYARSRRTMRADQLEKLHEANKTELWRARCWHCHTWNTAPRAELQTCNACGVNLWKRDETR